MNIIDCHILNIVKHNNISSFEISELDVESRITPGSSISSHLMVSEVLNNSICFKIQSILYWFNVGTTMDTTNWTNVHLPQIQLISDRTKAFIKAAKFNWNWLGPISTPLEYEFLCNARGNIDLYHYNPLNTNDTAFFLSFHKLFLINPKI